MPILTPSYLPHPPGLSPASPFRASSKATCLAAPSSQVPTPPTSPKQDPVTQRSDAPPKRARTLKIPSVKLDLPSIQENMAASLAIALVGHVLFLKSQVPFPVAQLGRVPGGTSASRAARKRSDMVTAFDELSSHLHTTFSALSTALAQNPAHRSTETVYLVLVLGPTIGAPKARVVLALEGLEVKIWGQREGVDGVGLSTDSPSEEDDDGDDDDEDSGSDDGSEAGDASTRGNINTKGEEDAESDGREAEESPPASEPPSSRSPSPSLEDPSQPSSPPPTSSIKRPLRPSLSPPKSWPSLGPKPTRTYAEEQQTLRAAERLLARTLANAYAEGAGMAAELAPTQTHVLLRAPRGFSHSAWLPRQNVSTTLDNTLQDFLVDSGLGDAPPSSSSSEGGGGDGGKARRRGVARVKTEGVLVTCQDGPDDDGDDGASHPVAATIPMATTTEAREEDELIWWAWDGKLVGFAEW